MPRRSRLRPAAMALLIAAAPLSGFADPPAATGGPAAGTGGPSGAMSGGEVFANRCAVCHGPQAAGIPGSFPSLHEQVIGFSKLAQGRDYLVMVVTTGLMGALKVGGIGYNGVMPAQSGLSEAEVAAVLNYLAGDLGKVELGASALSAKDVGEARARHPDRSAQGTRALRPAAEPMIAARRARSKLAAISLAAACGSIPVAFAADSGKPPGVDDPQRAWQH